MKSKMKVTIVSLYNNRPDFIQLQLESFKKHIKDDYEWIVLNNAHFNNDKTEEIDEACAELGVDSMRLLHKNGEYNGRDVSYLVGDSLNLMWNTRFKHTDGIFVILDCDFFLTDDISFNELLEGYDMAFVPSYTLNVAWPWSGIMVFDMKNIKVDDIDFGTTLIIGMSADVGSANYHYVVKHKPKCRYIDRLPIDEDCPIGDKTLSSLGFPQPYSVDLIGIDGRTFMFHYKTSSNYAAHCTPEYNKQKTIALKRLLDG